MCDDAGLANLADGRTASGTRSPTRWRDVVNRTRKGHRPSDRHRNCFRGQAWGNFPETRWSAFILGYFGRIDSILN